MMKDTPGKDSQGIDPRIPVKVDPDQYSFRRKIGMIKEYLVKHEALHQYLLTTLGTDRVADCEELTRLSETLQSEAKILVAKLNSPRLVIAIAGTTSSAKSTTINLFCGADMMPMEVGEMSAGVVVIRSAPTSRLIIDKTENAAWECGEFVGLSAAEIRKKLTRVMKRFHELKEEALEDSTLTAPAAPVVTVYYPLRSDLRSLLGIPEEIELELRDLPGIKSLSDETNRRELRRCEDALILLAYDARETDREKQKQLLRELVTLVEELGGSPRRFFFFASRVDIFRQNHPEDWPENEDEFMVKLWRRVQTEITKRRGNFAEALEAMQLHRLSPRPACIAYQMLHEAHTESDYVSILNSLPGYLFLVEGKYRISTYDAAADFAAKWQACARNLAEGAHASGFFAGLKAHIESQFFELIAEPVVGRFVRDGSAPYSRTATQLINAQIDATEENYAEAIRKLDEDEAQLDAMLTETEEMLRAPFEKLCAEIKRLRKIPGSSFSQPFDFLDSDLAQIPDYAAIKTELSSLSRWDVNMKRSVVELLEYCMKALRDGTEATPPPDALVLEGDYAYDFQEACEELREAGYAAFAETGKTFVKERDGAIIKTLNTKLNLFNRAIRDWVNALLADQAEKQQGFAYESLECLFIRHGEMVARRAEAISDKIGFETLSFGLERTSAVRFKKLTDLTGDPEEESRTVTNSRTVKYKETVPFIEIFGIKIGTKEIERTRIEYVERLETDLTFLGIEGLASKFREQLEKHSRGPSRQFALHLCGIVSTFLEEVRRSHLALLAKYRERLESARLDAQSGRDRDINAWNGAIELEKKAAKYCADSVIVRREKKA